MQRYYYSETFSTFLTQKSEYVLGCMDKKNEFDLTLEQRGAWLEEITLMKSVISALNCEGQILFEYTIPRLGKRVDVVLLAKGVVFTIEFKVGADAFLVNDKEQVWDYALDLKNFHEESRTRIIVPILVATEAPKKDCSLGMLPFSYYDDQVYYPLMSNAETLLPILRKVFAKTAPQAVLDAHEWAVSRYSPTPTIKISPSGMWMFRAAGELTGAEKEPRGSC